MGQYLIEKIENVAVVEKQHGHQKAAYSMQYARITGDELFDTLNERQFFEKNSVFDTFRNSYSETWLLLRGDFPCMNAEVMMLQ